MFFSMITKNLDWKTLTKNSVTFKRWDGLKDGLILWGFADFFFFFFWGGGGGTKNTKILGGLLKWGTAWTVCRFKRDLAKKRGWCF